MKSIASIILIFASLTACTAASTPPPTSTTILTYTISSPGDTLLPSQSAINTIIPIPTSEPTQTTEPTSKPTEEVAQWETVYDENNNPVEVVESSSGERFEVLVDSFVKDDKLMVIDEETGEWNEVAKIYTMEELMEQVPTEQEMIDFLNSDEIVRSKKSNGSTIPLGVGPQKSFSTDLGYREIDAVVMESPKLALFDIGDEFILSEFLPIVTTAGKDNLSNPEFLYLWLGAERVSWTAFSPNSTNVISEKSGTHHLYIPKIEEFSEVLIRGRQLNTRIDTWVSPDFREFQLTEYPNPAVKTYFKFSGDNIDSNKLLLEKLVSGYSVPNGSIIGLTGELVLTETTISDKKLSVATPPPPSQ